MSRGPQTFKQSDFTRALKAVGKAGLGVSRCELDLRAGKIVIIVGPHDAAAEAGSCRGLHHDDPEIEDAASLIG